MTSIDYIYIVIGLSLFVGFIIVFGILCYCKRRVARNRCETNQTVQDVSTHRNSGIQQAHVEDEIALEKSSDATVIKGDFDNGQRNQYTDEPNQDVHVNFEENQKKTLNTLERQTNYFNIDENEEGHYESGLSDTECGYSTIDELSADDECSEEGIYHRIDDVYSVQHSVSEISETDSVYAVIKDMFEFPTEPNYYLSMYGGSEDEHSDLPDYHRISSDLSEVESEASYTTIEEWELHRSTTIEHSVDEAGYLVITGSTDNIGEQICADAETNSEKNLASLDRPNKDNNTDQNVCTQNDQIA